MILEETVNETQLCEINFRRYVVYYVVYETVFSLKKEKIECKNISSTKIKHVFQINDFLESKLEINNCAFVFKKKLMLKSINIQTFQLNLRFNYILEKFRMIEMHRK